MDYEKAYKEALNRARKEYKTHESFNGFREMLLHIFPELKETEEKPNGGIVLEDFNEGDGFYKVNLAYLSKEQVEEIESIVKKWNHKPSELDEKIRKIISDILLIDSDEIREILDANDVLIQDVYAWLEKQGEQKSVDEIKPKFKHGDRVRNKKSGLEQTLGSCIEDVYEGAFPFPIKDQDDWELVKQTPADNVEPKFHEGDWVVSNKIGVLPWLIIEVTSTHYVMVSYRDCKIMVYLSDVDNDYHLWTIQDAKDGDVLIDKSGSRECPFIFKETKPSDIKTDILNPLAVLGYCGIGGAGFTKGSGWGDTANCIYYPATKEQRDLLFQKMKEAGCEWDSKQKEAIRIE